MADAGLTEADWLATVPDLVRECAEEWELGLGEPYPRGAAGYAVRAVLADGTPAVLKVVFPHREAEHEADALELYAGDGAVRLLARDDARDAMLLERCEPGTPLSSAGADTALEVIAGLLRRISKPAGEPFHALADEAEWWVSYLPRQWDESGRPFARRLLDAALDALDQLPPTQDAQVLLHQDLHADNVLAAEREPWLAIDPKPLVGELEFALAPVVRGGELGHSRRDVIDRLDRLSAELAVDRERARGWTIGQTLAWACDSGRWSDEHLDVVRWLVEAR